MSTLWSAGRPGRAIVVAHRAGAALGPENSLAALAACAALGVEAIETDARLSADGEAVACHDPDLLRLAGDPRRIDALDLAALRRAAPGVVRVRDLIAAAPPAMGIMLDLKPTAAEEARRCLAAVGPALRGGRVLIGVRSLEALEAATEIAPDAPVLALPGRTEGIEVLLAARPAWLRLWQGDATPARIAMLRAAGCRVWIMLGAPTDHGSGAAMAQDVAAVLALGPDAICLDDPRLAGPGAEPARV